MRSRKTFALLVLAVVAACLTANAVAATPKAKAKPNFCPIVAASGVLGASSSGGTSNLGGVAGGLALGANAVGGLSLDCGYVADTLTIQAPGHTFKPSAPVKCSGACGTCSATTTTVTCKLTASPQKLGISKVGLWANAINWTYAANDPAATNTKTGTCGISVKVTLAVGGATTYSKTALSACAYATGDVMR
ncbi:MAG TPA: hypothetical protein VG652_11605 [Gaiellaceae bacterium]|nr:hypothetical protein [Gaiellaceae bacterium]